MTSRVHSGGIGLNNCLINFVAECSAANLKVDYKKHVKEAWCTMGMDVGNNNC